MQEMKILGKTPEGKLVRGGVFLFVDTYGMPLEIMIELLAEKGMVVGWQEFYEDAVNAGWSKQSIIKKINEIGDLELREKILKYYERYKEHKKRIKGRIF